MDKIKLLFQNQKKIIEGFFVCLIGSWALISISRGVQEQILSLEKSARESFFLVAILWIIAMLAMAILYINNAKIARLLMFIIVYIFLVLCAYNGYNAQWEENSYNAIGNECFEAVLCFVAVLSFLYVKKDVFSVFARFKLTKKTTNIIVAMTGVFIFLFVGAVTVLRYVSYCNATFDFGIFTQMFEYMRQTGTVNTTVERNYLLSHFAVHFSPIYYIVLPIYYIFPHPVTLQLIQALMVALPVIPIVLLCRHYKLSNWVSVAASLLYILYPATAGGTYYDMHENCFLTFFILMTVWAVEKKKNIPFVICGLLSLMIKDDAAIYMMTVGLFFLFSRKDKKRGAILIVASFVWLAIAVAVVNSFGLGVLDNHFSNLYMDQDGSFIQIIKTIILNPAYIMAQVIRNATDSAMDKIGYLILMLVPIGGVLFRVKRKYSRYILLLPFLLVNCFPSYLYQHDVGFHYNFGTIALFMYLIIMNLADMKIPKAKTMVCISVMCASIMFVGSIFPKLIAYTERYEQNKETYQQLDKALATVPENASVCASGFFIPHLSKNLELYDQNHLENDIYTEYLVVDARYMEEQEKFADILSSGQYELVNKVDGIIEIYHKK